MIIAEPVQNAGGCLVPPDGLLGRPAGDRRPLRDRARRRRGHQRLRAHRRVVRRSTASAPRRTSSRARRASPRPTRRWAPCSSATASPRRSTRTARMLMHGITFGGHPVAARDRAAQHRDLRARGRARERPRARGAGAGRAGGDRGRRADRRRRARRRLLLGARARRGRRCGRASAPTSARRSLRGLPPGRLLEAGLIARPDDRGDAVLHLAPPLVCADAELEEMAAKTEAVLADASARFFAG